MGSKQTAGSLEYRVFTRVSKEKHEELMAMLKNSRCRTISELLRKILENKPVKLQTYDTTLDKVMEQLSGIRKELNAIGININQVTRYFHTEQTSEGKLFQALEIARLYQQTDLKVSELFLIIEKLSRRWLHE